jgi:hypothetical protein
MIGKLRKLINTRIVIFIIASLLIALYTLLMITGYSGVERDIRNTENKTFFGFYIFYKLMKNLGYKVEQWDGLGTLRDGILIFFNYDESHHRFIPDIERWVRSGNTLFFMGLDSKTDPLFGYDIVQGEYSEVNINKKLQEDVEDISFQTTTYLEHGKNGEILIGNTEGTLLVEEKLGGGEVYILSDNSLFSNMHLRDRNVAILLNNLFKDYYERRFSLYEYSTIIATSPILPLFSGRLFYITVHILLMGLIFLLWRAKRFGNPIRYKPFARRTLREHLTAVGYFYQKAHANRLVDKLDISYFTYQVKNILGIKRQVKVREIVRILQSRYTLDMEEKEIEELFQKAEDVSEKSLYRRRQERHSIIDHINRERKTITRRMTGGKKR